MAFDAKDTGSDTANVSEPVITNVTGNNKCPGGTHRDRMKINSADLKQKRNACNNIIGSGALAASQPLARCLPRQHRFGAL